MNVGTVAAAVAFGSLGLLPALLPPAAQVAPLEVLANRIVWSLVSSAGALTVRRHWAWLAGVLRRPKVLATFVLTALLLSANWLTYIWAVSNGHVLDASLGYFITPLVNATLGYSILGERPRHAQWVGRSPSPVAGVGRGSPSAPAAGHGSAW